jgi:hypothetical protein
VPISVSTKRDGAPWLRQPYLVFAPAPKRQRQAKESRSAPALAALNRHSIVNPLSASAKMFLVSEWQGHERTHSLWSPLAAV